jgi:hypothetical protein
LFFAAAKIKPMLLRDSQCPYWPGPELNIAMDSFGIWLAIWVGFTICAFVTSHPNILLQGVDNLNTLSDIEQLRNAHIGCCV